MNRKHEVIIGLLITICIVGFLGISMFNNIVDKNMLIGRLSEAIEKQDVKYLKDYIKIEGVEQSIDQETLADIVKILKDNNVHNNLMRYYHSPEPNIYLKDDGKEKLILNKYTLVLKPYNLTIKSNVPESKVFIDGKEVGIFEKDSYTFEYPNLLPGTHTVKLVYEGEYGDISSEEKITCFNEHEESIYHHQDLKANFVDIYSNREEATLYIDGKSTGINLSEGYTLGPLPTEKPLKISAKAKIDGKNYTSEEVTIDENKGFYDLYIDYEESLDSSIDYIDTITTVMDGYQYEMVEAINTNNYEYVEGYIESGSPLMKSQQKLIDNLYAKGITEELVDYTINDIKKVSDTIYEANVTEKHNIVYSSGDTKSVSNTWIYTIVKDGDKFYLRDLRK